MTGEQLRAELARVAERAPEVVVPADLFDRGRRATARIRVLGAASVVACVALVAGIGWAVLGPEEPPVADDGQRAGVPDHVYAPPDGVVDGLPLAPLDTVGAAVAAYSVDGEESVVVVTEEGDYLRVRLPDLREPAFDDASPSLSPDGRLLAYAYEVRGPAGVALVDLATGEVRRVPLGAPLGTAVRTVQWSPDSRWLVWSGQEVRTYSPNRVSYRDPIVGGRILASTGDNVPLPASGRVTWDGAGVCADGVVVRHVWPALLVTDDGPPVRQRSWRRVTEAHGGCSAPRALVEARLTEDDRLVGWLAGDSGGAPTAVVLSPRWTDDSQETYDGLSLRLVGDGEPRDVGVVESTWVSDVSIATGLMTEERPTVDAGPDPWPTWWEEHGTLTLALGAAGAAAAVVLGLLALLRRRRMS